MRRQRGSEPLDLRLGSLCKPESRAGGGETPETGTVTAIRSWGWPRQRKNASWSDEATRGLSGFSWPFCGGSGSQGSSRAVMKAHGPNPEVLQARQEPNGGPG